MLTQFDIPFAAGSDQRQQCLLPLTALSLRPEAAQTSATAAASRKMYVSNPIPLLSLPRKLLVSINSRALSFLSLRILGAVVQLDTHCRVVLVCNFFGRLSAV